MNQQFCPSFVMRPKLVPVVISPTVPVDYRPCDPPSPPYNIPLFPIHLPANAAPTMRQTRWDLEQLGSPTDNWTKELFFELAAQKNGIRIGKDQNKPGISSKQSGSLEDFKKIAERNGITVCPAGSEDKLEITSACSSSEKCSVVNSTADDLRGGETKSVSTTLAQIVLSSRLSAAAEDWENSCCETHVAKVENAHEAPENASVFEAEVEKEMNTVLPVVDLFTSNAARNRITIEEMKDLEEIQMVQSDIPSRNCETIAEETGEKLSTENKPDTVFYEPVVSVESQEKPAASTSHQENLKNENDQDPQIVRFQEMARLNGIKVNDRNSREFSGVSFSEEFEFVMDENAQDSDYCTDMYAYPYEQDPQIAMFQEIARLKGIKVSKSRSSSYSSSSPALSEDFLWPQGDMLDLLAKQSVDAKRDVFEELAKTNGIKVGKSEGISTETQVGAKKDLIDIVVTPPITSVTQASTQTDVTVVLDSCCQTVEAGNQTIGVQVSASKEAFEEEYLLWKLDDNATEDKEDSHYKDLYFDEKKLREELNTCLQNEKDVSANARHNYKRVMDQLKEELSGKSEEVEKLKKDLRTLKKHKETEIKRISKELKFKEEDLEATKTALQLKEAALEALRVVAQEQTAKLKSVEEQLEDMKTALSEVNKSNDCETCLKKRAETEGETGVKDSGQEKQSDDGWTVIVGKKSKCTMHESPSHDRKEDSGQKHEGVDQLCEIDLTSPPCSYRQSVGQESTVCDKQDTSSPCDAGSSELTGNNNACGEAKSHITVTSTQAGNITREIPLKEEPLTLLSSAQEPPLLSEKHWQNVLSIANSSEHQLPVNAHTSNGQQMAPVIVPPGFANQATPFPAIPPELLSQYLCSLQMLQIGIASGIGVPKHCMLSRCPPGLNTEPVPEGEAPEQSPPPVAPTGGKFSSFDKLMEALQKRFPSKSRQELILYLRKAKAVCGSVGFRGKHIPDVVKCVEDLVELEGRQELEERQE